MFNQDFGEGVIFIHPVTGDKLSTKHYYGIDLEQEGYIPLTDFNEIYNEGIDENDDEKI